MTALSEPVKLYFAGSTATWERLTLDPSRPYQSVSDAGQAEVVLLDATLPDVRLQSGQFADDTPVICLVSDGIAADLESTLIDAGVSCLNVELPPADLWRGIMSVVNVHRRAMQQQQKLTDEVVARIQSLFRTSHSLVKFEGVEAVLKTMIDDTCMLLNADAGVFYILDLDEKSIDYVIAGGRNHNPEITLLFSYDELMDGLSGWVIQECKVALSSGLNDDRESEQVQARRGQNQAHSILVAPLFFQDKPLGTMTFTRYANIAEFNQQDAELAETVANLAAVGVQNAMLFAEYSTNLKRTQILVNAARAVIRTQDLDELLTAMLDAIVTDFNGTNGIAVLFNTAEREIDLIHVDSFWQSSGIELPTFTYQEFEDNLIGHVINTRQAITSDKLGDDPRESPAVRARRHKTGVGSIMIAPIINIDQDVIIGVLTIVSEQEKPNFSPEDAVSLEAVASMAAVAIRNMQLHKKNHIALGYTNILLHAASTVLTAKTSVELLQTLIDILRKAFDADGGNFQIYDIKNRQTIFSGYNTELIDTVKELDKEGKYEFEELMDGITGHAIRTRKPQLSLDGEIDPREKPYMRARRIRNGVGTLMVAPIVSKTTVLGTLAIARDIGKPNFTLDDLNTLAAVANQIAPALINVRTYEDTKLHADTLARRVKERSAMLAERNIELKEANRQLLELDRMKDKFVADVSHELRTPVSSLKLYLNLLERGRKEKYVHYLATLNKEADRLGKLIDDILRLTRFNLNEGSVNFQKVDLHELLKQEYTMYTPQFEAAGLSLKYALMASQSVIDGVTAQLSEMIGILLANALKYTTVGGVLVTTLDSDDDTITLIVNDTGRGIPEGELDEIFNRFYRGSNAHDVPGAGLALSILQEIVRLHSGEVTVESVVGQGATFTIVLPRVRTLAEH